MAVANIIDDLRLEAEDLGYELEGMEPHETFGAQAAQALEEFEAALTQIAEGASDPQAIAKAALSLTEPLKPLDDAPLDPDAIIRAMLKPRAI